MPQPVFSIHFKQFKMITDLADLADREHFSFSISCDGFSTVLYDVANTWIARYTIPAHNLPKVAEPWETEPYDAITKIGLETNEMKSRIKPAIGKYGEHVKFGSDPSMPNLIRCGPVSIPLECYDIGLQLPGNNYSAPEVPKGYDSPAVVYSVRTKPFEHICSLLGEHIIFRYNDKRHFLIEDGVDKRDRFHPGTSVQMEQFSIPYQLNEPDVSKRTIINGRTMRDFLKPMAAYIPMTKITIRQDYPLMLEGNDVFGGFVEFIIAPRIISE